MEERNTVRTENGGTEERRNRERRNVRPEERKLKRNGGPDERKKGEDVE